MKIAFGMIVFNGDYVLRQCLEQVYPFASQILISEGPVSYWQQQGYKTSTDDTNSILDSFPDPEKKIKIIHSTFLEKDDQCKAYMNLVDEDTDYIWNLDSDEVYKQEDIKKIISLLEDKSPTSVGVQSCSFYGGLDHYLTGFELNTDNFLRIFKYEKGCTWLTHRPPTIRYKHEVNKLHISSKELFELTGVQMYHYSYVFPKQVYEKVSYYKNSISKENCIDNYFNEIYLPWVLGEKATRQLIEEKFNGVHEFKPQFRGDCYTKVFKSTHPESIESSLEELKLKHSIQLKHLIESRSAWYDNTVLPKHMIEAAIGNTWGFTLEQSPHFKFLSEAINVCINSATVLDVGCGAGEVGRVFPHINYTGCDLAHIVHNVSKIKNPNLSFFEFDAYNSSFEFCANYDIILCNSFLSEIESSFFVLEKILTHAKKYVIIHRQKFDTLNKPETYQTYGGLITTQNAISTSYFNALVKNKYKPLYVQITDTPNLQTIAMERI